MSRTATIAREKHASILRWAVERRTPVSLSSTVEQHWCVLKSQFLGMDEDQDLLLVAYPQAIGTAAIDIQPGQQLGVSFRRGHKKCLFVTTVVTRREDAPSENGAVDALVVRAPGDIRELQRRVYQRAVVPAERFIAVRLWEGGIAGESEVRWPLCSGRVVNASVGGIQIDIRSDQNPRLSIGDIVGLEITAAPGRPPLRLDGQYRHCSISAPGRLALGFQFVGLEHDLKGRSSISDVANFVHELQRAARHVGEDD